MAGPTSDSSVGSVGQLRDAYRRAAALLVPNIEDFGMVTVEALACGTPVVGLTASGTADVVRPGAKANSPRESASTHWWMPPREALDRQWDPEVLRHRAQVFSREQFRCGSRSSSTDWVSAGL